MGCLSTSYSFDGLDVWEKELNKKVSRRWQNEFEHKRINYPSTNDAEMLISKQWRTSVHSFSVPFDAFNIILVWKRKGALRNKCLHHLAVTFKLNIFKRWHESVDKCQNKRKENATITVICKKWGTSTFGWECFMNRKRLYALSQQISKIYREKWYCPIRFSQKCEENGAMKNAQFSRPRLNMKMQYTLLLG